MMEELGVTLPIDERLADAIRLAFKEGLEMAAEMAEEILEAARDPWDIPGELRKLREEL